VERVSGIGWLVFSHSALVFAVICLCVLVQRLMHRAHRVDDRVRNLEGIVMAPPKPCRSCRCTDAELLMSGGWWVEPDLCSSCADDIASSLESGRG
jgi:hypothetical protein